VHPGAALGASLVRRLRRSHDARRMRRRRRCSVGSLRVRRSAPRRGRAAEVHRICVVSAYSAWSNETPVQRYFRRRRRSPAGSLSTGLARPSLCDRGQIGPREKTGYRDACARDRTGPRTKACRPRRQFSGDHCLDSPLGGREFNKPVVNPQNKASFWALAGARLFNTGDRLPT